ncbi:MAG TPA: YfcE family phosphodiesterase [Acidobacteriota bacterium]|jgi:putative phosphoesterase
MRIALISDVHANLPALQCVLEDIRKRKIRRIYCAGDLVGDGPFPGEVLRLLRKHRVTSIRGNSDLKVLRARGERKKEREPLARWTLKRLTLSDLSQLEKLPARRQVQIGGKKILIVHGSPFSEMEYITPQRKPKELEEMLSETDCQILICGHSHESFVRRLKNGWVINCGAVGKHLNGTGHAQYAVLSISNGKVQASIEDVPYPRERLFRAAVDRNFPMDEESVITSFSALRDSPQMFRRQVISAQRSLLRTFMKAFEEAENDLKSSNVRLLRISAMKLLHALLTFSAYYPTGRLHLQEIRKIRMHAGELRELDVLLDQLSAYRKLQQTESAGFPVLMDEIANERESAQSRLARALHQSRQNRLFDELQDTLDYHIRKRPVKQAGVDPSEGTYANTRRLLKQMATKARSRLESARNPLDREEFHRLRVSCKKLRYTLEIFESVGSRNFETELEKLQDFQKLMGKIHDLDTCTDRIIALRSTLRRRLTPAELRITDYLVQLFQRDRVHLFEECLQASYEFENSNFFQLLIPGPAAMAGGNGGN